MDYWTEAAANQGLESGRNSLKAAGSAVLRGILRLRVIFALGREGHTTLRMTER